MNLKPLVLCAVLAGFGGSALAGTLTFIDGTAAFTGSVSGESYDFTSVAGQSLDDGLVVSSLLKKTGNTYTGFDITKVTLDGLTIGTDTLVKVVGNSYSDQYTFSGALAAGAHTLAVFGTVSGASSGFSGTVSLVPEAEGYSMALAGLALVGGLARRRARKV